MTARAFEGDQQPEQKTIDLDWHDVDALPILAANCFAVSVPRAGDIYLAIGAATPPIFPGLPEQQLLKLRELQSMHVQPLVRMILSPERARELINALRTAVENNEKAREIEAGQA